MKLKIGALNPFRKNKKKPESKMIQVESTKNYGGFTIFGNRNSDSLPSFEALKYYATSSAVYTAVSLLASEISSLHPVVFDTKSKTYEDHPVLELLKNPNKGESYNLFISSIASTLISTGNSFIIADGNINRPPLFLNHYNSTDVSAHESAIDKFPQSYRLTRRNVSETFDRLDIIGQNRFLFVNQTKDSEIWQSKVFSPNTYDLYGMSPLTAICIEISQLQLSNVHNLATLENGGAPSGIMHTADSISDAKFELYKAMLNENYAGSTNAGRIMLLDEQDLKYEELGKTNKDMDFLNLKQSVTHAIYSALKIPLPLISADQMTLANMETARLNLYDNAVLPWADKIFGDLTSLLMPRYDSSENLIITYDQDNVDALQIRRNEELSELNSLNALTVNEMRAMIGKEELDGGNSLYQQQSMVPFAGDVDTSDNIKPKQDSEVDKVISQFKSQKKPDGSQVFNEDEIKILTDSLTKTESSSS